MNINKISIAKETLELLEKNSWDKISLSKIKNNKKKIIFKNKYQLLTNLNQYFDYEMKKSLSNLELSSTKDMLFEVIMARLDILNIYRVSVKNLIKHFYYKPYQFIKLIPSLIESIIIICSFSKINVNGIKGVANIKIIFALYILIIYTWNFDQTESSEKTMTTLDKYLNIIDKYFSLS